MKNGKPESWREYLREGTELLGCLFLVTLLGYPLVALLGFGLSLIPGLSGDPDGFGYWMHTRLWAASGLAWIYAVWSSSRWDIDRDDSKDTEEYLD